VIVEFVGLPGSGKSTAAQRLLDLAEESEIIASRLPLAPGRGPGGTGRSLMSLVEESRLLISRVITVVTYPRMLRGLIDGVRLSRRSRAEKWFALRHAVVTAHAVSHARSSTGGNELVVAPEGICQKAFSLFVEGAGVATEHTARRFVVGAPRSDVVIFLQTSPRVAYKRLQNRDHGPLSYRFGDLSEAELMDRFSDGQRLILDAAEHLAARSRSSTQTFVLNADDLAQALERIGNEIFPFLRTCIGSRDQ
jgi:thymidylate kinase